MSLNRTTKTLVFDIETDGLWFEVSRFWVGVTYCIETKEFNTYRDVDSMLVSLNKATKLIGHNVISYDIPVLNKLGTKVIDNTIDIIDTLLLAKLAYYKEDKSFKFSLEAFGARLGYPKGIYTDWTKYSSDMEEYCRRDVEVTTKLYQHLKRKTTWLPIEALQLEQDVQEIISRQEKVGWKFDTKKAQALHIELEIELQEAIDSLDKVFRPLLLPYGKPRTPKKTFRRLGVTTVGINQPIRLTNFNAGSGKHIVWWIELLYGSQVWEYTDKGSPKTDSRNLIRMFSEYSWAKPLLHYMEVKKLLGQLATGGKAWLKEVKEDNRIYGSVDILGTVTGRFTHARPNLAQVPSSRAYKGKEVRSLFIAKKGYKLVGADASGLELRTLSHYLARHDGGAYGKVLLEGDIHTANQKSAGLPNRDMAKTFIYGYLYGAGDAKIGEIVGGTAKEGAILKKKFLNKTIGLSVLVDGVKKASKRGYLVGLSGRRLYVRSPHSALNTLLQSCGAYYMKYYLVDVDIAFTKANLDYKFVGNVHDEFSVEVLDGQEELCIKIAEETFISTGKRLGLRIKMEGEAKAGNSWLETH